MRISYKQSEAAGSRLARWIRRILLAWLTAAAAEYLLLPGAVRTLEGLDALALESPARMALIAAAVLTALTAASRVLPESAERWFLPAVAAVLAALTLMASFTWAFFAAWAGVLAVLTVYACRGWNCGALPAAAAGREKKGWCWLAAAGALAFFAFVSVWTVCRVYSFSTPTFDFSIFAQMFYSMRTTGLPVTTVERDGALSHFAVHVSPIYYLLLPIYCLVPTPATLQVLQAAVLASAVIPLWKLGKRHGLSPTARTAVCFLMLLYPAYSAGTSYDIHENAFLTPLLLWLLYGIDCRSAALTAVFGALTLTVKEDAAVYTAVIGLYLLVRSVLGERKKWDLAAGALLFGGALAWFLAVTAYLSSSGDGVMAYRYGNFMYDGSSSLLTVVKAVLLCPMKAMFECVDAEKLSFIALTLLPLGCLPLLTRRYERYILLIPYLLVNLMSDYKYQHDIFFQYTYGSSACLIYLTVVNLADWRGARTRLAAAGLALCIGAGCFSAEVLPTALRYPSYCLTYGDYYAALRRTLDVIPDDASVAATTFYTTYLSQRTALYDVRYASAEHIFGCEYVVVGVTDKNSLKKFASDDGDGYEAFVSLLAEEGYTCVASYEDRLEVYQRSAEAAYRSG